jgi:hypothetical protein
MKNFFFVSRIQNVMPARALCAICGDTDEQTRFRDLDFGGRFICDDCLEHDNAAEEFLRRQCRFDCPTDELIEQHL